MKIYKRNAYPLVSTKFLIEYIDQKIQETESMIEKYTKEKNRDKILMWEAIDVVLKQEKEDILCLIES